MNQAAAPGHQGCAKAQYADALVIGKEPANATRVVTTSIHRIFIESSEFRILQQV